MYAPETECCSHKFPDVQHQASTIAVKVLAISALDNVGSTSLRDDRKEDLALHLGVQYRDGHEASICAQYHETSTGQRTWLTSPVITILLFERFTHCAVANVKQWCQDPEPVSLRDHMEGVVQ